MRVNTAYANETWRDNKTVEERNEEILILSAVCSPYFTCRAICRRKKFINAVSSIIIPYVVRAKCIIVKLRGQQVVCKTHKKRDCNCLSVYAITKFLPAMSILMYIAQNEYQESSREIAKQNTIMARTEIDFVDTMK